MIIMRNIFLIIALFIFFNNQALFAQDTPNKENKKTELVFRVRERTPEQVKRAEELSAALGSKKGQAIKNGRRIASIPFYGIE